MKKNIKLRCTIHIKSAVNINWNDYFDQIEFRYENDITVLSGIFEDQAALHGILAMIRNLNIEIKSIDCKEIEENQNGNRA